MPKVEPVFFFIRRSRILVLLSLDRTVRTRRSSIVEPSSWRLAGIYRVSIPHQTRPHLPQSSAWCSPCDPSGVFLPGRFSAPEENERDTRERREKRYAVLTSRVTFVGHCTSHQIASGVFVLGSAIDGAYQKQTQRKGVSRGRGRGNRSRVHCGGYWSLISGRSLLFIEAGAD